MSFNKLFKILGVFLAGAFTLSVAFYLTCLFCSTIDLFNEYFVCSLLGLSYSVIVLFFENKISQKIKISKRSYLLSAVFLPTLFFIIFTTLLCYKNNQTSIFGTNITEPMYYFLFMSMIFSVSCVIICVAKAISLLKNKLICL